MNPYNPNDLLTIKDVLKSLKKKGFVFRHRSAMMRWFRKYKIGKLYDFTPPKGSVTKIWKVRRQDLNDLIKKMKDNPKFERERNVQNS